MSDATRGNRLGEHAVYPGTFNPITPGYLDVIERARHHFARVTVLVAVNIDNQPAASPSERAAQVRRELPADWAILETWLAELAAAQLREQVPDEAVQQLGTLRTGEVLVL